MPGPDLPGSAPAGVPAVGAFKSFQLPRIPTQDYLIAGITKDLNSAPLGGCVVKLYYTATDAFYQQTVSDANGNYHFYVPQGVQFYAVAYLPGSPDVTGASLNTMTGV